MKHKNWRELAEAVGFVTVVAVLLMIALEQRGANRIAEQVAEAEAHRSLAAMYTSMNMARAANPEVSRIFAKMAAPQGQLITVTDTAQMRAIAQQYINIASAAEFAYQRELLPQSELENLRRELQATIERYPGLHESLVDAYNELDEAGSYYSVLEPVARLAAGQD